MAGSRDFRRLWVTAGLTTVGDAVTAVAVPLLAIVEFRSSAVAVAVLVAADQAGWLLLGLPSGVWLDRIRVRRAIQAAYGVRGLALLSVPAAYLLGGLTYGQVLAAVVVSGAAGVVTSTGTLALTPRVVPADRLVEANSRLSVTTTAASLAGHPAGGVLVGVVGGPWALAVEGVTSLVSTVVLRGVREVDRDGDPEPARFRQMLAEGLRYTLAHPLFRAITLCNAVVNLLTAAQYVLIFVFLTRVLDVPAAGVGFLVATGGIGGLAGAAAVRRLAARRGTGGAWRLSLLVLPLFALLLASAQRDVGLVLFALGDAGAAAAVAVGSVLGGSARQAACPPELIGRMSATSRTLTWGVIPLGALLGGAAGSLLGIRAALVVVGVAYVLPLLLAWPRRCGPCGTWRAPKSGCPPDPDPPHSISVPVEVFLSASLGPAGYAPDILAGPIVGSGGGSWLNR